MQAAGFTAADFEDDFVEYWPENSSAVHLFIRCGTQWRTGMGGPTGLDYAAVYPLMDRMQLDPEQWDYLLDEIGTLESAALQAINDRD